MDGHGIEGFFLDEEGRSLLAESVLEQSPDGVLVVDHDWKMVYFNRRFVEMWDIPEEIQRLRDDKQSIQTVLDKLEDPEGFLKKVEFLHASPELSSRDELRLKDGRVFDRFSSPLRDRQGKILGRIWFFRDITEKIRVFERRKVLEARLKDFEKLQSLRTFAAAISHHLNNMLMVIVGSLEMAEYILKDGDVRLLPKFIRQAREMTDKAAAFSNSMGDFLGDRPLRLNPVTLGPFMEELEKELGQGIPSDVSLVVGPVSDTDRDLIVKADGVLLGECIRSAVNNAVDAVQESSGQGEVRISWQLDQPWEEEREGEHSRYDHAPGLWFGEHGPAGGRFVRISIEDDGIGLDEELGSKVFDPFFSTKEFGRGMGLAVVQGIVHSHGGQVAFSSRPGEGSRLDIFLPLVSQGDLVSSPSS